MADSKDPSSNSPHFPRGGIEPDFSRVEREFEVFIRGQGLKLTSQRRRILKRVFGIHRHFTAEEVHETFRRSRDQISRATVYRTLSLLVEGGFLDILDLGSERKYYEHILGHDVHDHLVCLGCGLVLEFQEPRIDRIQHEIMARHDFSSASHSLRLFGYCPTCRAAGESSEDAAPDKRRETGTGSS